MNNRKINETFVYFNQIVILHISINSKKEQLQLFLIYNKILFTTSTMHRPTKVY